MRMLGLDFYAVTDEAARPVPDKLETVVGAAEALTLTTNPPHPIFSIDKSLVVPGDSLPSISEAPAPGGDDGSVRRSVERPA